MPTASQIFTQSELSQAAYADLYNGILQNDLIAALVDTGFTQLQAEDFASTYTVIDRKFDDTGLSVTLFEDTSGKQHVAIRGTQDGMDFLTDIIFIGLVGSITRQKQYAALSAYVRGWMC